MARGGHWRAASTTGRCWERPGRKHKALRQVCSRRHRHERSSLTPSSSHAFPPRQVGDGSDASLYKLVFSGRVLADTLTLAEASFQESDFMVLMISKPKAAAAVPPAAPSAVPAPPATTAPAAAAPPQAPPAPAAPEAAPPLAEAPAAPAVDEATVANLCEMGFPREQAIAGALSAVWPLCQLTSWSFV